MEKAQAGGTAKAALVADLKQWADTLQPAGKAPELAGGRQSSRRENPDRRHRRPARCPVAGRIADRASGLGTGTGSGRAATVDKLEVLVKEQRMSSMKTWIKLCAMMSALGASSPAATRP